MHFASTILMIRPAAFGYNEQTAASNTFQERFSLHDLQQKVLSEFDGMVAALRAVGITVIVIDDTPEPPKPDAVFPNNWFCTLPNGSVATFPMYATNRRVERRKDIIEQLLHRFKVTSLEDWTAHEEHHLHLEGTGSMVMDHGNKIIYGCTSERTSPLLLHKFAENAGYDIVLFSALDKSGLSIYHTNVMMCIGNGFCVVCDEVIDHPDIDAFNASFKKSNTRLIRITYNQMMHFAGNMLQLQNENGEHYLVMSQSAFNMLDAEQLSELKKHTQLLPVNITTIETIGGGSARCMMAEIFLLQADT